MKKPEQGITEIRAFYTWMGKDGIARTEVKPSIDIDIVDAMENSRIINDFQTSSNYPLIINAKELKSISKEARDYYSLKNRESKVYAFAIIIGSGLSRTIANFFIQLNKPVVPTKLFTVEKKAIEWTKLIRETKE